MVTVDKNLLLTKLTNFAVFRNIQSNNVHLRLEEDELFMYFLNPYIKISLVVYNPQKVSFRTTVSLDVLLKTLRKFEENEIVLRYDGELIISNLKNTARVNLQVLGNIQESDFDELMYFIKNIKNQKDLIKITVNKQLINLKNSTFSPIGKPFCFTKNYTLYADRILIISTKEVFTDSEEPLILPGEAVILLTDFRSKEKDDLIVNVSPSKKIVFFENREGDFFSFQIKTNNYSIPTDKELSELFFENLDTGVVDLSLNASLFFKILNKFFENLTDKRSIKFEYTKDKLIISQNNFSLFSERILMKDEDFTVVKDASNKNYIEFLTDEYVLRNLRFLTKENDFINISFTDIPITENKKEGLGIKFTGRTENGNYFTILVAKLIPQGG